jgi:hypothetical protein
VQDRTKSGTAVRGTRVSGSGGRQKKCAGGLLTAAFGSYTLTNMRSKEALVQELLQALQSMVQGSLSEITRQCGDPACACSRDPTRRHGPHLYLKFNAQGKTHSVYVPPEQGEAIKRAHAAWLRFQEIGAQVSGDNRARWLRTLERDKQAAKAMRARARRQPK